MRIENSKINKNVLVMVILTIVVYLSLGVTRVQASGLKRDDPAVGTASPEVENMIAQAKSLIGKTPYVWGGGHGNWDTQKEKAIADGLDCSTYVSWALYRGMGIGMGGKAQNTTGMLKYGELVGEGSAENAQRGDFIWTPGHIEIYLGKNSDGEHITVHAQNEKRGIGITPLNWGNGARSAKVLRITLEDARAGKRGLDYDSSRVVETGAPGVSGTGSGSGGSDSGGSTSGGVGWGDFTEEDLYRWKEPIVDFKSGNTHAESKEEEAKSTDGNNKGLKGNKGGIFSTIFGR